MSQVDPAVTQQEPVVQPVVQPVTQQEPVVQPVVQEENQQNQQQQPQGVLQRVPPELQPVVQQVFRNVIDEFVAKADSELQKDVLPETIVKLIQKTVNNKVNLVNRTMISNQINRVLNDHENTMQKLDILSTAFVTTTLFNLISYNAMNKTKDGSLLIVDKVDFRRQNLSLPLMIAGGIYFLMAYVTYRKNKAIKRLHGSLSCWF